MTNEQWLAALLNGTVGAILSIGGVLFVYWLTRKSDRKRISDERMRQSVADVAERSMPLRYLSPGSPEEEEVIESVAEALLLFYIRELGTHRGPAEWANRQRENLHTVLEPRADIRAARLYAAHVVAKFSTWATHGFTKGYLEEDDVRIGVYWMGENDVYDMSVKVSREEALNPDPETQQRIEKALR